MRRSCTSKKITTCSHVNTLHFGCASSRSAPGYHAYIVAQVNGWPYKKVSIALSIFCILHSKKAVLVSPFQYFTYYQCLPMFYFLVGLKALMKNYISIELVTEWVVWFHKSMLALALPCLLSNFVPKYYRLPILWIRNILAIFVLRTILTIFHIDHKNILINFFPDRMWSIPSSIIEMQCDSSLCSKLYKDFVRQVIRDDEIWWWGRDRHTKHVKAKKT